MVLSRNETSNLLENFDREGRRGLENAMSYCIQSSGRSNLPLGDPFPEHFRLLQYLQTSRSLLNTAQYVDERSAGISNCWLRSFGDGVRRVSAGFAVEVWVPRKEYTHDGSLGNSPEIHQPWDEVDTGKSRYRYRHFDDFASIPLVDSSET
jgi:hypothetical protein